MSSILYRSNGCILNWKIRNINPCWFKTEEGIETPPLIVPSLEGTKWSLSLYPMGWDKEKYVAVYLHRESDINGPSYIHISHQFAIVGRGGIVVFKKSCQVDLFQKGSIFGFPKFLSYEKMFVTERETFLSEDTLNVQCILYRANEVPTKLIPMFPTTDIKVKRKDFVWKLEKVSDLKSEMKYNFKDYLINFDLVLKEDLESMNIRMNSFDNSVIYVSYEISVIDENGEKVNFGTDKYFSNDLKTELKSKVLFGEALRGLKRKYIPQDVLSLHIEFVISTIEHFELKNKSELVKGVVDKEKPRALADDLESLYKDGILSDMELRTLTKTFRVHTHILSARSDVFRSKFSPNTSEKKCEYIEVPDFDNDTIERMNLYLYTDSLEGLQIEEAYKLRDIAHEYGITSLESRCVSFFLENLNPTNACSILEIAVKYPDDDLKNTVENYILRESKQIFCSQEWNAFRKTHCELAGDIMYRKITKNTMHLQQDG